VTKLGGIQPYNLSMTTLFQEARQNPHHGSSRLDPLILPYRYRVKEEWCGLGSYTKSSYFAMLRAGGVM